MISKVIWNIPSLASYCQISLQIVVIKKWSIHDILNVSRLKYHSNKRRRIDKNIDQKNFDSCYENKKYEIKAFCKNAVYALE